LVMIPKGMGQVSGEFVVGAVVQESATQSQKFYHSNTHCEGCRDVNWAVHARTGWDIDTPSIAAAVENGSGLQGIFDRSEKGFQIRGRVCNRGACGPKVPFTNTHAGLDGRGDLGVRVNYVEKRNLPGSKRIAINSAQLNWDSDLSFKVPDATSAYSLSIKLVNGRTMTITSAEVPTHPWFKLVYDKGASVLVLRPNSIDSAF